MHAVRTVNGKYFELFLIFFHLNGLISFECSNSQGVFVRSSKRICEKGNSVLRALCVHAVQTVNSA